MSSFLETRAARLGTTAVFAVLMALSVLAYLGYQDWLHAEDERNVAILIADARHCYRNLAFEEAQRDLECVRTRYPDSPRRHEALMMLGDLYLEAYGDVDSALACFESASLQTHFPWTQSDSDRVRRDYATRMSDRGMAYANLAYRTYVMARHAMQNGQGDLGVSQMLVIPDSYPQSAVAPLAYLTVGNYYLRKLGLRSQARKYYGFMVARYPRCPEVAMLPRPLELDGPDIPHAQPIPDRS